MVKSKPTKRSNPVDDAPAKQTCPHCGAQAWGSRMGDGTPIYVCVRCGTWSRRLDTKDPQLTLQF